MSRYLHITQNTHYFTRKQDIAKMYLGKIQTLILHKVTYNQVHRFTLHPGDQGMALK